MLEEKDLQAIGTLLDQKLKENNQSLKTEIFGEMDKKFELQERKIIGEMDRRFDEVLSVMNETFSEHEKRFDSMDQRFDRLEAEIAKRPTRDEMFNWADNRFIDLELAKDRHDYLHIDDLDKLPAPLEISQALIERGFKQKQVVKNP